MPVTTTNGTGSTGSPSLFCTTVRINDATNKNLVGGFKSFGVGHHTVTSDGDIRVLLALNVVLSLLFASIVLWGLDFIGEAEFTLRNLAVGTLAVTVVTYATVLRQ